MRSLVNCRYRWELAKPTWPRYVGQKWQLGAEVDVLFAPQQKPKASKRMAQVMEPNASVACALDAGDSQHLMKRLAERRDRIPTPPRAGEQRRLGEAGSEVLNGARAALNDAL